MVKNRMNAHKYPEPCWKTALPSLTLPDNGMSLQEIVRRFAQGAPVPGAKQPIFNGDEDLPNLRTMDLADREAFLDQVNQEIIEIKERINKFNQSQKQQNDNEQQRNRTENPAINEGQSSNQKPMDTTPNSLRDQHQTNRPADNTNTTQ